MANKFKKGDLVIVIAGSDKGKTGKILAIKEDKVLVENVNLATIHKKPTQNTAGEIVKTAKPIHISNISHIEDGKKVRIGFKVDTKKGDDKGKSKPYAVKERISKKTSKKIN